MMVSTTLFGYISRKFALNILGMLSILLGIVFILDTIELMRRSADYTDVSFGIILGMAAMKLPHVGQQIVPFGILFAAIYTCWKLNRTHELVVMRAAGLSAWQFLSPMIFIALMAGTIMTTMINPISSIMLTKYEQMEIVHLRKNDHLVTVSRTGIWLRQPTADGYALVHAAGFDQNEWRFNTLTVFFLDNQNDYIRRVDSPVAYLQNGFWDIRNASIHENGVAKRQALLQIPTNLTSNTIEESFADPEMVSFWKIPDHLKIMQETGLPITSLQIHFQSLLAEPFLLAAMVLLAATFSLRPPRFGGTGMMVAFGVGVGFFIFFMESMLHAFGISQKIPIYLAAWTPALVSCLLGVAALLHKEDG